MGRAGGSRGGRFAARRAVVRWAVRMLRREWRQQLLMLVLVTVAVTGAVAGASMAYGRASTSDWRFGDANIQIILSSDDPDLLAQRVVEAREWFGTVEAIGHRQVEIPGWEGVFDIRALAERGQFSDPTMDVMDGRYPSGPGEIALTDDVATILDADLGSDVELEDRTWRLVGLVENPGDLDEEFALTSPRHALPPTEVELLLDADEDLVHRWPRGEVGIEETFDVNDPAEGRTEQAMVLLLVEAVVLLLVGLVAAAGFVVVAQRRQRQIGLLAATGATDEHLRLVMLANGVAVGTVAAVLGTMLGLAVWVAVAPAVEASAGHRIGRFDLPWPVIAACAVLGVLATAAAAWWPARTVARLPVTAALSGRPPQPKRSRRSAVPGVLLLAAGVGAIVWSNPNWYLEHELTRPAHDAALIVGVLAIGVGMLFVCPLAVRLLSATTGRLPLAARVAIRDLARYRARSSAALAAISLTLGIPIAIVLVAEATEQQSDEGNLSERQMLVSLGESGAPIVQERTPAQLRRLEEGIGDMTSSMGDASVVPLLKPYDPTAGTQDLEGNQRWAVDLGLPMDDGYRDVTTYVATADLMAHLGVDPADLPPDTEVLTTDTRQMYFLTQTNRGNEQVAEHVVRIEAPQYSAMPTTLVTEAIVRDNGWQTAEAGWLIKADGALTDEQMAAAREVAADVGLTVETRRDYSNASLRSISVGGGMVLALSILAMTVGLIRSETADDVRILTATGAGGRTRRGLTAATAGALALLGVLVGGFGAYLGLVAGYVREPSYLGRVPVVELVVVVIGMPLLATLAGWLFGGREPSSLTRPRVPLA